MPRSTPRAHPRRCAAPGPGASGPCGTRSKALAGPVGDCHDPQRGWCRRTGRARAHAGADGQDAAGPAPDDGRHAGQARRGDRRQWQRRQQDHDPALHHTGAGGTPSGAQRAERPLHERTAVAQREHHALQVHLHKPAQQRCRRGHADQRQGLHHEDGGRQHGGRTPAAHGHEPDRHLGRRRLRHTADAEAAPRAPQPARALPSRGAGLPFSVAGPRLRGPDG
jgi:hypothetical protein